MAAERRSERFARLAVLVRDTVHPSDAPRLPYIGLEHIAEGTLRLVGTGIAEDATSLKARFSAGDILFGKLRPYFRYVGAEAQQDDGEPFEQKMARLVAQLREQQAEAAKLDAAIAANLKELGYGT